MPSVVKRGKKYTAVYYAPNDAGIMTQRWRSTGETDSRRAMRIAVELEERARKEVMENSRRCFDVVERASHLAGKGLLTIAGAQEFISELYALSSGESLARHTVAEWLKIWLEQKKPLTKPATFARYDNSVKSFTQFLKSDSMRPLEAITVDHLRKYRDGLKGAGRTSKTCNGYLKDLRAAFRAAVREGHLLKSPTETLEFLPEDDSVERQPFTLDEIQKLVDTAPSEDWKGVILLGAFAGMRIGDAATLRVENVDLKELVFRFKPAKTSRQKKTLIVPLHPELISYFKTKTLAEEGDAPCFPTLNKKSVSGRLGLSLLFGRIIDEAGIDRNMNRDVTSTTGAREKGVGRRSHALSFHSLRHSFVSMMANGDVGAELRMKLAGHTTGDVHEIYTSTEVKTLRRAIEAIPRLK